MMKLNNKDIDKLERKFRLNLINSISGIKPANLIGTRSKNGIDNLAIFSSVVHLGSNPAQLGFIVRPFAEHPRDTYSNILETQYYTINGVPLELTKKAHYTSAKLDQGVSEFEVMNIEKEFMDDFHAPFVKSSPIKIGMKHLDSIPLPNGCMMVIGSVELLMVPEVSINDLGQLDLSHINSAGISGLNSYYSLNKLTTYPYVRVSEIPEFE